MSRTVREDQHGTITGYVYGCRCSRCYTSAREYRQSREPSVSAETVSQVLSVLERDADLDGVVVSSHMRLGELAGVSHATVGIAVRQLAKAGRISILGRSDSRGRALEIQLLDSEGMADTG